PRHQHHDRQHHDVLRSRWQRHGPLGGAVAPGHGVSAQQMRMKTLLLSTVAALALGGGANATNLACSTPQFLVGQDSKDPQDTVNRIEISHSSNSPEWQVHHRFQNGTMVMREEQYAMVDAPSPNGWVWQGRLRKNGAITMVGEVRRDSQGQAY